MSSSVDFWNILLNNYEEMMDLLNELKFPRLEEHDNLTILLNTIIDEIGGNPELMEKEILSTSSVSESLAHKFFEVRDTLCDFIDMYGENLRILEEILSLSEESLSLARTASSIPRNIYIRTLIVSNNYKNIQSSCLNSMRILESLLIQIFVLNLEELMSDEDDEMFNAFIENIEEELLEQRGNKFEEARSFPNAWL